MIKRTIEVSGPQTRLSVRLGQVLISRDGESIGQIPAEDIGVLIVDSPTASYTHGALVELVEKGALVVLCGGDHHPAAMVAPVTANSVQTQRVRQQADAKAPARKQLWKQIVQAKLRNQAAICEDDPTRERILALAERVRSGDPANVEAQAARLHWAAYLGGGAEFHRQREGPPPNNLLNYGYMALRACVARAVCAAGLHPSLGLQHSNRFDAFCLADDLMEPFRPLVDYRARELYRLGLKEIDKETKKQLLALLAHPCGLKGQDGPLMVAVERMLASLCRCYAGEEKRLAIPELESYAALPF